MTKIYALSNVVIEDPDAPAPQDERTEAAEKMWGTVGLSMDPMQELDTLIGTSAVANDYYMVQDKEQRVVFVSDSTSVTYYYQYTNTPTPELLRWREYDIQTKLTTQYEMVPDTSKSDYAQVSGALKAIDSFSSIDTMSIVRQTIKEYIVSAPLGQPEFLEFSDEDQKLVSICFTESPYVTLTINTII